MIKLLVILSLVAAFHRGIAFGTEDTNKAISSIFEGFGYSPVCIAKALAICELSSGTNRSENNVNSASEAKAFLSLQDIIAEKKKARNCYELLIMGDTASDVKTVYPYDCCRNREMKVYCDQTTDGGGWTVFQRRDNLTTREDFYRTWIEYSLGFGNITGEYWLGLDNIHALVSSTLMELRVDLEDYDLVKRWAKYGAFYVGDSSSKYTLSVGRYSGDAGDGLREHNGMKFSTYDHDNDPSSANIAATYRGAHWYPGGHGSNFNGYQYVGKHASFADSVGWRDFRGHHYSLKMVSLKVRPAFKQ